MLVARGLAPTRSQAEDLIRRKQVVVDGKIAEKAGLMVDDDTDIHLKAGERYVSRAGLKLASVAQMLGVDFAGAIVLDVGSSTGGFTDYALKHGAQKVIAVDVGTDQLHPSLRADERIELHEKTDIRDFVPTQTPAIVVMDVSFISLRQILPHITRLVSDDTKVVAMVKPQFEADRQQLTKTGIVKNDRIRRDILKSFEQWASRDWKIVDKADSEVAGTHGNRERFYHLRILQK